jgi:hypothetical protein
MGSALKLALILGTVLCLLVSWAMASSDQGSSMGELLVWWPAFVIGVLALRGFTLLLQRAEQAGAAAVDRVLAPKTKRVDDQE